jgi:hypothetical protein
MADRDGPAVDEVGKIVEKYMPGEKGSNWKVASLCLPTAT